MAKFAYVIGGTVAEVIPLRVKNLARDVPLAERYAPEFVAMCHEIPSGVDVKPGYTFDGTSYAPPAPLVPIVPASVTARQARLALLELGKLEAVTTAIAALPSPQREQAQIEWDFATTIDRASPLVTLLGKKLKLDLDAVFSDAAQR